MKKVGTFVEPGASELVISLRQCVSRTVDFRFSKPRQLGGVLSFWTGSPEQRNHTSALVPVIPNSLQSSAEKVQSFLRAPSPTGVRLPLAPPILYPDEPQRWTEYPSFIGPGFKSIGATF